MHQIMVRIVHHVKMLRDGLPPDLRSEVDLSGLRSDLLIS